MYKNKIINIKYKVLFVILIMVLNLNAKDKTIVKIGAALTYVSLPEYIGSSNRLSYLFPHPTVYYKSKSFTVEKNKVFNHLYKKNKLSIDISFSGTVPVKNDKKSLRFEMDDLDPTLEVGPNFMYKLTSNKNKKYYINIEVPVRSIWSLNLKQINNVGYSFSPKIYSKYKFNKRNNISFSFGPTFASSKYNNYFYEVKLHESNANREIYTSSSGYTGWANSIVYRHERKKMAISFFLKQYDLKDAKFEDSPLVAKRYSTFYGGGISYLF